ncbi:hypothetical protein IT399_01865 [Candidatus Nomurabacteria bacterium]|nr:hypothetical protein [Candidatus Nomurabacteria bacterium]
MDYIIKKYKNWKYKNTFLLVISVVILFYFADSNFVKNIIHQISNLSFWGVFIAGIFFVSTFTVAPASLVLFYLAKELNLFGVIVFAGFGAMLGDYIIFRFLKDKVFEELKPIFTKLEGSYISKLFSTPYFIWLVPVIGAIIIASPFPDEIGISLLGVTKLKNWQFLLLSFILNSLGILFIITFANLF